MGVAVLGSYTRVRWASLDEAAMPRLETHGATRLDAEKLLTDVHELWGLATCQNVVVRGQEVRRRTVTEHELHALVRIEAFIDERYEGAVAAWPRNPEDEEDEWEPYPDRNDFLDALTVNDCALWEACAGWDERIEQTTDLPDDAKASLRTLPETGCWLVAVEHGEHPWAALRVTTPTTTANLTFEWSELVLPGAGKLTLGHPRCGERKFELVWPASKELPQQAGLDVRTDQLLTNPLVPDDGECPLLYRPLYRYGILCNGELRWLNLLSAVAPEPLRPSTELLRARLALLRRELEARGVNYEDDEDACLYELSHALEDSAVPTNFHEPSASIIRSVSSYYDHENKLNRAEATYDPEQDLDIDPRRLGYRTLVSEVDVTGVRLGAIPDAISGRQVSLEWLRDVFARAVTAAGLSGDLDGVEIDSTDKEQLEKCGGGVPQIPWNAVEAADRIQRLVYLLAEDHSQLETRLSENRDAIVATLVAVYEIAPLPPNRQPGPFPARCVAVMPLAEALLAGISQITLCRNAKVAITDPSEWNLAVFWADRLGINFEPLTSLGDDYPFDVPQANVWAAENVLLRVGSLDHGLASEAELAALFPPAEGIGSSRIHGRAAGHEK